jgi:hypothetical protein
MLILPDAKKQHYFIGQRAIKIMGSKPAAKEAVKAI